MTRTFQDAYTAARKVAQAGDRAAATALLSNLLWHVDGAAGGFIGLSDEQLAEKCEADPRIDYSIAVSAMHAPTAWVSA